MGVFDIIYNESEVIEQVKDMAGKKRLKELFTREYRENGRGQVCLQSLMMCTPRNSNLRRNLEFLSGSLISEVDVLYWLEFGGLDLKLSDVVKSELRIKNLIGCSFRSDSFDIDKSKLLIDDISSLNYKIQNQIYFNPDNVNFFKTHKFNNLKIIDNTTNIFEAMPVLKGFRAEEIILDLNNLRNLYSNNIKKNSSFIDYVYEFAQNNEFDNLKINYKTTFNGRVKDDVKIFTKQSIEEDYQKSKIYHYEHIRY